MVLEYFIKGENVLIISINARRYPKISDMQIFFFNGHGWREFQQFNGLYEDYFVFFNETAIFPMPTSKSLTYMVSPYKLLLQDYQFSAKKVTFAQLLGVSELP